MKRVFAIVITSVVCVLYLTSCIDDEYDLDKDINTEINVGGEYLSLPLGTTDTIVLSELFDFDDEGEDEFIKALENGNYSISYKDSVDIEGVKIKSVVVEAKIPTIPSFTINSMSTLPINRDVTSNGNSSKSGSIAPLDTIRFEMKGDKMITTSIKIDEIIPNEIEKLFSAEVNNGEGASLEIEIKFATPSNKIILESLTIDFPNIFVFENQEVLSDTTVGFVFNDMIEQTGDELIFRKTLTLKSFDFTKGDYIIAGNSIQNFKLDKCINIIGTIAVPLDELNLESLILELSPSISLDEMTFSKVEGIFNPKVDPINEAFEFDDLPDFLQGDDVNLDFMNPIIKFKVSNTLGIPMIADAKITPMIGGVPQTNKEVTAKLNVDPAAVPGVPTLSKFWLSESDDDVSGWYCVNAPIGLLLEKIPDSLNIEVGVTTDKTTESHTIDLTKTYDLKVNYEVDVPLALGAEFKINYSDTIKDIGEDLEDVIDKITSLSLDIEATNSVPLNMEIDLIPVDKDFEEIDGIEVEIDGKILAGTKNDNAMIGGETDPRTGELSVKLKETKAGALAKLFHFVVSIKADTENSPASGVTLNENQYLILKLKARIEGGITIDLDE